MSGQIQENRLKNFASFFKGYMSVMPLVTAALAPILTLSKALPVFESQKTTLATVSGLLGFLIVAWVFSARGTFIPLMTPRSTPVRLYSDKMDHLLHSAGDTLVSSTRLGVSLLPLCLIAFSAYSYVRYSSLLDENVDKIRTKALSGKAAAIDTESMLAKPATTQQTGKSPSAGVAFASEKIVKSEVYMTKKSILESAGDADSLPNGNALLGWYLSIFLCAELAFVFMALREYAYGTLQISEREVLSGALSKPTGGGPALSGSKPIAQ